MEKIDPLTEKAIAQVAKEEEERIVQWRAYLIRKKNRLEKVIQKQIDEVLEKSTQLERLFHDAIENGQWKALDEYIGILDEERDNIEAAIRNAKQKEKQ